MLEGMMGYLRAMVGDTYIFRAAVISFAICYALTPPERSVRGIGIFLLQFLGVNIAKHILGMFNQGIWNALGIDLVFYIFFEFLVNVIVCIGYSLIFCRFRGKIKVVMTGSVLAAIVLSVNLCYAFGSFVDRMVDGWTIPVLIAVYAILAVFAIMTVKLPLFDFIDFPMGTFVLCICADVICIFASVFMQIFGMMYLYVDYYFINSVVLFALYVLLFLLYISVYMMCREREDAISARLEKRATEAIASQLALSKQNIENMHKVRHDYRNRCAYMSFLLNEGRLEELQDCLAETAGEMEFSENVKCANMEVAAVLNMEYGKAEKEGIRLECELYIPRELPFAAADLCSVLSNCIDNAIESNVRYGITDPISVRMSLKQDYLYTCVSNRLPEGVDEKKILSMRTAKSEDRLSHGLGHRIVEHIAEKYSGHALYDIADGNFIAEILLDLGWKSEKENKETEPGRGKEA